MGDHATPLDGTRFFATSWDPEHLDFPADADFQTGIGDWILRGELDDPADALMSGKSVPRIWLLLHEPGEGRLAAVTALSLARELMGRDQAVLVLDCDEDRALLAGWADRHDQEGWIDLVRYGASLLTCGVRLPFPGRQGLLLGPGSYRPVDAQPAEIEQLLAGLRRQADDILLCCPIGESGRAWAQQADVRLLCWDLTRGVRNQLESLVDRLKNSATPLTGVVSFGEEPEPVAAGPVADEADASADEPDPLAALVEMDTAPTDTLTGDGAGTQASAAEPPTDDDAGAERDEDEDERPAQPVGRPAAAGPAPDLYARKRGTSRVFWWIALAALVLIAGSFWYYREYVMVGPLDAEPTVARTEEPRRQDTPPAAGTQTGAGADEATVQPAGDDTGQETVPAAATAPEGPGPAEPVGQQPVDSGGTAEPADAGSAATGTAPAPTPAVEEPTAAGFQMDPYLVPVGSDGWALHIYSFPDSLDAARELEILRRRGFQTAVRAVQIKDKGRWLRIYLGSFASKAEAQRELEPLLKELGEDWGRPTEF